MQPIVISLILAACGGGKLTIDGQIGDPTTDQPGADTGGEDLLDSGDPSRTDEDGDGFTADIDCDDADPDAFPGAPEYCDGRDQDCDGEVDEDAIDAETWHQDEDGDGYGAALISGCDRPDSAATTGEDCDDANADIHPGATEICGDRIDNDCDGGPGDCRIAGIVGLDQATSVIYGEAAEDAIGSHAIRAGDVTGDGQDDLLIGIPDSDARTTDAGLVAVISSPGSEATTEDAVLRLEGHQVGDRAGFALAGAGYVNDDIIGDILIGAPGADGVETDGGAAYLVLGGSTGTIDLNESFVTFLGEAQGDQAGFSVIRIGDFSGDGVSSFAIGAPTASLPTSESGAVYVVRPDSGGVFNLSTAEARYVGTTEGEQAGRHIGAAQDLDGDGLSDFVVGAPFHHGGTTGVDSGRLYIVFGGTDEGPLNESSILINGEGDYAYVGLDSAVASDLNGDGEPDLVVGSGNADSGGQDSGEVYVMFGPFSSDRSILSADVVITGESVFDFAGNALASPGDYNGDGADDLMLGAIGNDYGGVASGAGYVLYGPITEDSDLSTADIKLHGLDDNDHAGTHIGSAGDMDGDGRTDIFIGAPYVDHTEINAGALYIFSGNAGM